MKIFLRSLIFITFFGSLETRAAQTEWDEDGVKIELRSQNPFLSNFALGTIEILASKTPSPRHSVLLVTNIWRTEGTTNIRRTWSFHLKDNYELAFLVKTNFVLPPALLAILETEKGRILKENETLKLALANLSAQNLSRIVLYSVTKFAGGLRLGEISTLEELIEAKEKLSYFSNLQGSVKSGKALSVPGYHKFYYPSSVTGREEYFEILLPGQLAPASIKTTVQTNDKSKPKELRIFRATYFLGDNELSLRDFLPGYFNTNGLEVILKNSFVNGSSSFTLENKKIFDEFRGIIEASLPIRKEAVSLASVEDSLASLTYFSYAPSRYAASGLVEYSSAINPASLPQISKGLEGIPKPSFISIERQVEKEAENPGESSSRKNEKASPPTFLHTFSNGMSRDTLSKVLSNANIISRKLPYLETNLLPALSEMSKFFEGKETLPAPISLKFSVSDPNFGGSRYYLSVENLVSTNKPGTIDFKILGDKVSINVSNVESFSIDLTYPVFQDMNPLIISINGKIAFGENVKGFSVVTFKNEGRTYYFR